LFCCFIEVTMTVVKSVSDGLRDSETQLNLNRPLRISPGPRHLSRPLATWAASLASDNMPGADECHSSPKCIWFGQLLVGVLFFFGSLLCGVL
jgi:hypothetical protein